MRTPGKRSTEDGMVILAAALLLVLIAMAALVADGGILLLGRSDISMAVDFAAVAGAQELPDQGAARDEALRYAQLNLNRSLYPASAPRISFPNPNTIRVEAEMGLQSTFLRALGVDALDVGAEAEATRFDPDVALVIDRSGSMCDDSHNTGNGCPNDGTPWEPFTTIQRTANDFVDQIPGDPTWAVVSYSNNARLDLAPTTNRALVHATIDSLTPGGRTDIAGSLLLAIDQILLTLGRAPKLIILLTDGKPNAVNGVPVSEAQAAQAVMDAAAYAFSQGILLYAINYGNNADNTLMQAAAEATEGGQFYHAPDGATLEGVYDDIANRRLVRLTYVD